MELCTPKQILCIQEQPLRLIQRQPLKSLHQFLAHSPHASPLAENIHRNRKEQQSELNDAKSYKDRSCSIILHPVDNEQREDQAVENICTKVELS